MIHSRDEELESLRDELAELDVNPFMAGPRAEASRAVDARMRLK